jgi:glucose/arabinose dehydrogenase
VRSLTVVGVVLVLGSAVGVSTAEAQVAVPAGFRNTTFVSSIPSGTAMAFAPDGRLFVCQQAGAVRVVKQGQLLATPFLTLTVDSAGERGLLGLAFDPQFASNQFVYVYYTTPTTPRRNRVSRFTAAGDVAVSGSEVVLLELDNLSGATNHNGGALAFGPDGALYVAVGDNATGSNAQTLGNRLGKILRVNADGTIPSDNPFFNVASGANRAIWALGLRNPFTFAFDAGSGRIYINDVGQTTYEEVNEGVAGANYGWPLSEGPTSTPGHTGPIYWYGHSASSSPKGCAITGGTFYPPTATAFPSSYGGDYFFADYCTGFILVRDAATGVVSPFATGLAFPVDLDIGPDGRLYYLSRGGALVGRISYDTLQVTALTPSPAPPFVAGVQVTWAATLAPGAPSDVEYQFWQYSSASGQWTSAPYSPASTYAFTPPSPGNYALQVWVRTVGSGAAFEATRASGIFSVGSATATPLVLTLTQQLPRAVGESGTFTASAQGGVAPHMFQYWLYRPDTKAWSVARPYDTSPTWVFTPTTAGAHAVQVWARSAGSTAPHDAAKSTGFFTVAPSTPSVPTLTASPGTTVAAGTPITWTGQSTGGAQPTQYKFWLYTQATGSWQVAQDWSADNTWLWVPALPGTYAVQLWVRAAGSTATYQAFTGSGFFVISP